MYIYIYDVYCMYVIFFVSLKLMCAISACMYYIVDYILCCDAYLCYGDRRMLDLD